MQLRFSPRARHRAAYLADAGVSSLSNLSLVGTAAVLLPLADVGRLSIAMSVVLLALGISRAWIGEYLLYAPIASEADEWFSSSIVVGFGLACMALATSVLLPVTWPTRFALSIAIMPAVCQDAARHRGFARREARTALRADTVWLIVVGLGVTALVMVKAVTPHGLILVWAFGALCGLVASTSLTLERPGRWLRRDSSLRVDLVGEFLLRTGVPHVLGILLAPVVGLSSFGAFKTAQLAFGATTVANGAYVALEAPRLTSSHGQTRIAPRISAGAVILTLIAAAVASLTLSIPSDLASRAVQDWALVRPYVLPVGLHMTAIAASQAGIVGLRVLDRSRTSLTLRLVAAPVVLGAPYLAAINGGMIAAAWTLAVVTWVLTAARHVVLIRADASFARAAQEIGVLHPGTIAP